MKKIINIKRMPILFAMIIFLSCMSTTVRANVQSLAGTTFASYISDNWFIAVRNMEASGGVLGLSATLDENYLESTSASNSIDAHPVKNTEWGTVLTLINSNYGVGISQITPSKTKTTNDYVSIESSTKNFTGIFGLRTAYMATPGNYTIYGPNMLAAFRDTSSLSTLSLLYSKVPVRYYDDYSSGNGKYGDSSEYYSIQTRTDIAFLRMSDQSFYGAALNRLEVGRFSYAVIINGTGV